MGTRPPGAHRLAATPGRHRVLGLALVVILIIGGALITRHLLAEHFSSKVPRVPDAFQGLERAPRPPATDSLTFLLVGGDSLSTEPTSGSDALTGANRGSLPHDMLMLVRIDPARTSASVVSIPPDSWVEVPGQGRNTINSAYTAGGPPLLVDTVERLTRIRVDHFGVIDLAGFRSMVDALGGVDVRIAAQTSHDGVTFRPGANHLDGAQALAYLRQRQGLPRGDLDRAQRQQNVLRALLEKAAATDLSGNPLQMYQLLDAVSRSTSVDDTMNNDALRKLRREISALPPTAVTFLASPVRGLGREGAQSVVYLDDQRAFGLWEALGSDSTSEYARLHPGDSLGATPP